MASPFAVFRRNQKVLLAVAGIAAIIIFVLGDPLQRMMTDGSQGPTNPVVVETKYGDYTESDLAALRQARQLVDQFLQCAIEQTVDAEISKGQWDARSRNMVINELSSKWRNNLMGRSKPPNSEAAAIETITLANKAKEMGMVVSDRAINDLLAELTFDSLSSETLQQIIDTLNGGRRVSAVRLFEAIRTELLAANLSQLFAQSLADFPPAQKFEFFLRLNQRAKAEIMPLAVADFASQVKNPDEATLEKFFEKYKDRLPDAASPEPGFKELPRAAFQYFKADFAKFQEEMKPKVTDEEIRDYYEKNKAQFVELDLPEQPADDSAPGEAKPDEDAEKAPGNEGSGDESKEPAEPKPAGESAPQASDEPPTEGPADAKPDDAPKSTEPPQEDQSSAASQAHMRLVSMARGPSTSRAMSRRMPRTSRLPHKRLRPAKGRRRPRGRQKLPRKSQPSRRRPKRPTSRRRVTPLRQPIPRRSPTRSPASRATSRWRRSRTRFVKALPVRWQPSGSARSSTSFRPRCGRMPTTWTSIARATTRTSSRPSRCHLPSWPRNSGWKRRSCRW